MMQLELRRDTFLDDCTLGRLYQVYPDGREDYLCETLEDKVREIDGKPVNEWKLYGQTAIPRGTYRIILDQSAKFGRLMPRLLMVPGFDGVRIHAGNTARDTEGCILLGVGRGPHSITHSRAGFERVFNLIRYAKADGLRVSISVQ